MYKVLVVDDEPIVRVALKTLVKWESCGYLFDFEASNGKQAIKLINDNPDIAIVITDLKMPVMDGFELISEIKKKDLKIQIVVLSGYNDYDLVRQAFKLGASDYILKSEMDPHNIIKLLNDLVEHFNLKINSASSINNRDLRHQKEELLMQLTQNENIDQIKDKVTELGIRLSGHNLVVCFLYIDNYQTVIERYSNGNLKPMITSINNGIYQVLNEANMGEAISISPQEYAIYLSIESVSFSNTRNILSEVLGKIKYVLSNYFNIKVSIGVSQIKSGFYNINELYRNAEANAKLRFILGKERIIFPEDASCILGAESIDAGRIIGYESEFLSALKNVDKEHVFDELEKLLNRIKKIKFDKIEKIHCYYMELLFVMIKYLNDIGEDSGDIFGKEVDFYYKIMQFETLEEINIWIRNITAFLLDFLQNKKEIKVNHLITRAQEFIKLNFNNNITLKMVSEFVGLSEGYTSKLFTLNLGMTFSDYLTNIKINKAKELIASTNMKIYEICYMVGYESVEHFSRVFKKVTGYSPNSFKNHD
ncbi:MAG: response regulator transcription factor [Ruminiclostridium sp.]